MKRRDFATGLLAAGAAGPALASNEPDKPTHLRLQISIPPGGRHIFINGIMFVSGRNAATVFDTTPPFRYRNENRLVIRNLTPPRIADEVKTADRVAEVRLHRDMLVVDYPVTREAETTLKVGDEGTSILIGGLKRRTSKETGDVPVLGELPYLGALFRTRDSTATRQELLIFMTARIIKGA